MPTSISPKTVAKPVVDETHALPEKAMAVAQVDDLKKSAAAMEEIQSEVTVLETQDPVTTHDDVFERDDYRNEQQTVARTAAPRSAVSSAPVREIPPVQQAQRQRTAAAGTRTDNATSPDMRVTQLTTATNQPAAAGLSVNQRAQSLFQRITGFGMVRPSAVKEMEDELDMDDEREEQVELAATGTSDRSALSSGESDLLDIPAFLRRQSNH